MSIAVQVDVRDAEVLLKLRNGEKRLVFAIANAARATALEVQRVQKERLGNAITLRDKSEFMKRQIAVITFPKPKEGVVEARVRIGEKEGLFLSKLEKGFERAPVVGKNVAVPVEARPSERAPIPQELYVKRLGLRRRGRSRGKKTPGPGSIRGRSGTYLIPEVGIFQRLGPGPSRLLYLLVDPFRVHARLNWIAVSKATIRRFFPGELRRQVVETIRFQRARGTL